MAIFTFLSMSACQEWGESDPPAGNQKLPEKPDTSAKLIAEFTFDEDFNSTSSEGETPIIGEVFAYSVGQETPVIIQDVDRGNGVMHADGGYLRIANPLIGKEIQTGVSFSFYVKTTQTDNTGALISFSDGTNKLHYTANAFLSYTGTGGYLDINDPAVSLTNAMPSGTWHYVALTFTKDGYAIYIDGIKKYDTNNHASISSGKSRAVSVGAFDYANIVDLLKSSTYIYLGYGSDTETKEAYYDDLKVWTNTFGDSDAVGPGGSGSVSVPTPVYINTFDSSYGLSIVGTGKFTKVADERFGNVFQNVGGAKRTNYLVLPENLLTHSAESKEISIGVWVNASNAGVSSDYSFSPLFMAYGAAPVNGANTWPMFALQYRGLAQINCAGHCDFTPAQNVTGVNTEYNTDNDWLADKQWHYYTATITPTSCKIYFDGVIKNEWIIDGVTAGQIVSGLFTNGADLKYICLGGNQAWDWGDNDGGFMFDDMAVYDKVLSESQIKKIIEDKNTVLPTPVYTNTFENGAGDAQIIGKGSIASVTDKGFGKVFQNVASTAPRQNYLLLPENAMSHSTESKEMSIGVWVNAKNAGGSSAYAWAPLFTAYGKAPVNGANETDPWPVFLLEYRGTAEVNWGGWCSFLDAQNTKGVNTLYHNDKDWLADNEWHYYTAVFTTTSGEIFIDGESANKWVVDGISENQIIAGLFSAGTAFKYICLGGNQGYAWGDNDPGFLFDDLSIYNKALAATEIQAIMKKKKN